MIKKKPVNHKHNCNCSVCERIRTPPSTKMLLTLPIDMHDSVRILAYKKGVSISEVVRLGIEEYLKVNPVTEQEGKTLIEILAEEGTLIK